MKRLFRHACAMLAVLLVMSMFTVENAYVPYLIATTDVQFTSGDDVCKKAAELCKDAKTDMDKVTAIYNYIAGHYTYDTKLANDITSGKVSKYIPDTAATLNSNKGICYDLASLFAAMCRSQDHPLRPHQGLRRQQLPRLEQGQRQRQLVPDRHDLCRHQARHQRDHLRRLRLPPDLLPAERHARCVRGGVNPHNSSKDGGRYSLPPSFLRGIRSVNILYIFENRLAFWANLVYCEHKILANANICAARRKATVQKKAQQAKACVAKPRI